jgi:hypothetical protein
MKNKHAGNQDKAQSDNTLSNSSAKPKTESAHANGEQNKPKQRRNYSKYIVRALKAGRECAVERAGKFVVWADAKHGFITALATIVIAFLTGVYVYYSQKQWQIA